MIVSYRVSSYALIRFGPGVCAGPSLTEAGYHGIRPHALPRGGRTDPDTAPQHLRSTFGGRQTRRACARFRASQRNSSIVQLSFPTLTVVETTSFRGAVPRLRR